MLVVALVPAAVALGWWFWTRDIPPTSMVAQAAERSAAIVFKEPWLRVFLLRALAVLPLTALFAWTAVALPRGRWWLVPLWGAGLVWLNHVVDLPGEMWIAVFEPPFTARLGPFGYDLPQETFTFAAAGNILRVGGIDFFEYTQERIWTPEAWRALYMLGLGLAALLLAEMSSRLWDWRRGPRRAGSLSLLVAVYALGALLLVVSLAFPGDLFDRYVLSFVPFVILFVVAGAARWGRRAWGYTLVAFLLLATFSVLAKADHVDHANARWQAGRWMQARVGQVHVGFDWNNWMGGGSPVYQVADVPLDGFRIEQQFPYQCRLCGFTTRYVLAQAQADQPPLPTAPTFPVTAYP
jgi:hypothetical protein